MSTDSVADLLTRIRNAQRANFSSVEVPASKMNKSILAVLHSEGYVGKIEEKKAGSFSNYSVALKYLDQNQPLIKEIKRVSKPGCRVYKGVNDLPRIKSGLGISIVSTPQGVMTDREARSRNIGGELLAIVG